MRRKGSKNLTQKETMKRWEAEIAYREYQLRLKEYKRKQKEV